MHNSPTGELANTETVATTPVESALPQTASAYEAPAIESVVTFDNLQREILYAGGGGPSTDNPPLP